ncbi:MAG TPA: tetratricopeptide repeat protein [bacterium]|nr:tetratricopeptide repeat protein [bacterium]
MKKIQISALVAIILISAASAGLCEDMIGDTYFKKGNTCYKEQKYDQAADYYQQAVDINPEHLGAMYNLALAYQMRGLYGKAEEYFKKSLALDATYLPAWVGLGLINTRQGRYDDAIAAYKEALKFEKDYYIAHLNLAAVYAKKKMYKEAVEESKTALNINPREINGHLLLGNIYNVNKEYDKAIEEYEWILKIEPKFFLAQLHISTAYAEKGDFEKALQHIQMARQLTDKAEFIHYFLGRMYVRQYEKTKDPASLDKAIAELNQSVKFSEQLLEVFIDLGKAYELKNDTVKALRAYRRYVDNPLAQEEQKQEVARIIAGLRERMMNENISPKLPVAADIKDAKKKQGN